MSGGSGFGRLFVALDLPEEVAEALERWARGALRGHRRRVRVLPPESLHLTLCFLGNRVLDEATVIAAAMEECAEPVAALEIGAPVWLPPRRPRLLAVEVHDEDGALAALQGRLSAALVEGIGWEPDRRRFRPHVTVARLPEGAAPRERELVATPPLRCGGESLTLFRSFLDREGAVYEGLASVEL